MVNCPKPGETNHLTSGSETLHRELVRAYRAPDVREQLRSGGSYAAADTPEEFAAFLRAEQQKWSRVVREAGIKAQ